MGCEVVEIKKTNKQGEEDPKGKNVELKIKIPKLRTPKELIASAESVPFGSPADVQLTEEDSSKTLHFKIPTGADGEDAVKQYGVNWHYQHYQRPPTLQITPHSELVQVYNNEINTMAVAIDEAWNKFQSSQCNTTYPANAALIAEFDAAKSSLQWAAIA